MDELLAHWETQLALAHELLRDTPMEAVARVRTTLRQARAALAAGTSGEAQERKLRSFVARAEHLSDEWQTVLATWQAEAAERERSFREREMAALTEPLPRKLYPR